MSKPCKYCRIVKPLADFGRDPQYSDGLAKACRVCRSATRAPRTDKEKAAAKVYSEKNPKPLGQYKARYPEKRAAHVALNNALRDGRVTKTACFVCGAEKVEAHHAHYGLPLGVIWLCRKHHMDCHRLCFGVVRVLALEVAQPQLALAGVTP